MTTTITITSFDKRNLAKLQDDIIAALEDVAEAHGVSIRAGRGTFSETGATLKLEVALKNESGIGGKEADAFRDLAPIFGLKTTDLGRSFAMSGMTHTITGFKSGRTTKPIITKASNGKSYVWPTDMVKLLLEKTATSVAG